ncbi:hypothetical protein J1605_014680 [Eschrichtius robustus]|uniref:Uncharacterized protein n=1 Tax=Eschrichtius robustus TaxID=9764 RepID=A0AB34GD95_ESCRO|nr:hypothetical protein J1605_014680 [Eschrichtius robustus]
MLEKKVVFKGKGNRAHGVRGWAAGAWSRAGVPAREEVGAGRQGAGRSLGASRSLIPGRKPGSAQSTERAARGRQLAILSEAQGLGRTDRRSEYRDAQRTRAPRRSQPGLHPEAGSRTCPAGSPALLPPGSRASARWPPPPK